LERHLGNVANDDHRRIGVFLRDSQEKDKGWICDLVPKSLVVARYFAEEQRAIDKLAAELETVSATRTDLEEEHGGEEDVFSDFDKVNKGSVVARLKEIIGDPDAEEEARVLNNWLEISDQETSLKKKLKDAERALDSKAYAKYPELTEKEVQFLVVDDKWLGTLDAAIHGEIDRICQALARRLKELAERYETPMPRIVNSVVDLEKRMNSHLGKMGFLWT
jgi:type I restriction enzyme M protein